MTHRTRRLAEALTITMAVILSASGVRGEPVSSIVYPPSPRGMRMSHATAAHIARACVQCHTAAPTSAHAAESLVPLERSCAPCHDDRLDRAPKAAPTQCGYCHRGYDPKLNPSIAAVRAPPARMRFSHKRHDQAGVACARCHQSAPSAAQPSLPSMDSCLQCHTGTRMLPCNGCHESLPSGRLRTAFPEGKLMPRGALLGMAHDSDFSVRHRWLAGDEGAPCKSCHVERDCTECHDGQRRPRGIHPNDYLTLHAQDAERNASRCNSCHTTQSFCLPCHARLGVASVSAPDLAAPKRVHPSTSTWLRGPNLHVREAQRSLTTCVSCHAERDCVRCHGAKAVGGAGASPHPPGFKADCASLLGNSERPCRLCHGDLDALRAKCR